MSDLTDDLQRELNPTAPCKMCDILALLPVDDEQNIREAIGIAPHAIVARVLTRHGHQVSGAVIARHIEKGHQ